MRAVTKWLAFAFATTAPPVGLGSLNLYRPWASGIACHTALLAGHFLLLLFDQSSKFVG
jgi:hypothetical protein